MYGSCHFPIENLLLKIVKHSINNFFVGQKGLNPLVLRHTFKHSQAYYEIEKKADWSAYHKYCRSVRYFTSFTIKFYRDVSFRYVCLSQCFELNRIFLIHL